VRRALICFAALLAVSAQLAYAQSWAEYKPEGAGYSLEMPGEWTVTQQTVDTKVGSIVMHTATVDQGSRVYMTIYAAYPEADVAGKPVSPILDGARDGAVNNVHGTLRSEQRILVSNYPGRFIIVDAPQGVFIDKFFLLDNKLIQALVGGSPGIETEATTTRFLDSLRVVSD
jgi:hypothetical protein